METANEVNGKGLEAFLNKKIFIVCASYFYSGTLKEINADCVLLEDAKFVLESGSFEGTGLKSYEKVRGGKIYVTKSSIESFFDSHE